MDIREQLLKFRQVKDVAVGTKYIAVKFKYHLFRLDPQESIDIFDLLYALGYELITEFGREADKLIFRKIEEK